MKIFLISLLLGLACAKPPLRAAGLLRVCVSGCDFNLANSGGKPLQAAINAAQPGDIIEVEAGQTFSDNVFLPPKNGDNYITVRSSRWAELPPAGTRIDPARHGHLLPTVQAFHPESVLWTGAYRNPVTEFNFQTDEMTFVYPWTAATKAVTCSSRSFVWPTGVEGQQKYYLRRSSTTKARLSLTPTGPFVDLRDAGQGVFSCADWDNGHHFRFSGIRWTLPQPMNLGTYALVTIGTSDEGSPASQPHHIDFDHCVFTGHPHMDSPRTGLILNGRHLNLRDSWVGHIKQFLGESKAVVSWASAGPVDIRNNYLSAASLGVIIGGSPNGSGLVTHDLTIVNNHIVKDGAYHYKEGDGPPVGRCYYRGGSGSFYRDKQVSPNTCANGACYECQPDETWALKTDAVYRDKHYQTKSGVEFKQCDNCTIEGNVIEGAFAGLDSGNMFCINITTLPEGGGINYISDVKIENNDCRDTWSGIALVSNRDPGLRRSGNYLVRNNLITGMASFPALSYWPDAPTVQVRPLSLVTGLEGVVVDHNTFRSDPSAVYQAQYGLLIFDGPPQFGPLRNVQVTNNVMPAGLYTWFLAGVTGLGCNALSEYVPNFPPASFRSNAFYGPDATTLYHSCPQSQQIHSVLSEAAVRFAGTAQSAGGRLAADSPFAAACANNCLTKATDGTDLGVDMQELRAATTGVQQGIPTWKAEANIQVNAGSYKAIVSFRRLAPRCEVRIFSEAARLNLIPDTASPEQQADDREGNTGDGPFRQFVLGTNSLLSPATSYFGLLVCESRTVPFRFQTQAAGSETAELGVELRDAAAHDAVVLVSEHANMSEATALSPVLFSGGKAQTKVTVPAGQVRYVRWQKRNSAGDPLPGAAAPVRAYINR